MGSGIGLIFLYATWSKFKSVCSGLQYTSLSSCNSRSNALSYFVYNWPVLMLDGVFNSLKAGKRREGG